MELVNSDLSEPPHATVNPNGRSVTCLLLGAAWQSNLQSINQIITDFLDTY